MSFRKTKGLPSIVALTFAFSILNLSCKPAENPPKVSRVTPLESVGLLQNDFAVLVDIRAQEETLSGMANRAIGMPFPKPGNEAALTDWLKRAESLPRDKQIIVYGNNGEDSAAAASELAKRGFRASDMGAFADWARAKLPVQKPKGPSAK